MFVYVCVQVRSTHRKARRHQSESSDHSEGAPSQDGQDTEDQPMGKVGVVICVGGAGAWSIPFRT